MNGGFRFTFYFHSALQLMKVIVVEKSLNLSAREQEFVSKDKFVVIHKKQEQIC